MEDRGKKHCHFLLKIALISLFFSSVCDSAKQEIAFGKKAWQTSTQNGSDAFLAVDGRNATCSLTNETQGEYWRLDLGQEHMVQSVVLIANSSLSIKVSNDDSGPPHILGLCQNFAGESPVVLRNVTCSNQMKGRFVYIETTYAHPVLLCEVKVFECQSGYYGPDCQSNCRCINGDICDRSTGICPNECAPGYRGTNCSTVCSDNRFGADCKGYCHCYQSAVCDKVSGKCPSDKCEEYWVGQQCQTEYPDMRKQDGPELMSKQAAAVKLSWNPWQGQRSKDVQVQYTVQFRKLSLSSPWTDAEKTILQTDHDKDTPMNDWVTDLDFGVHYEFRVIPTLVMEKGTIKGQPSRPSKPIKSGCAPPDPPEIISVVPYVDNSTDPPSLGLEVIWKKFELSQVHCDGVNYFEISYQVINSEEEWMKVVVVSNVTSKNITGLTYNQVYLVRVTVANNANQLGISSMQEVLMVPPGVKTPLRLMPTGPDKSMVAAIAVVVLIVLLVSIICLSLFIYKRRRKRADGMISREDTEEKMPLNNGIKVDMSDQPFNGDLDDSGVGDGTASENTPSSVATMDEDKPEKPELTGLVLPEKKVELTIDELDDYVMQNSVNNYQGLKNEYEEIPLGFHNKTEVGKSNENRHKNRFVNIVAYDHSRVVLMKEEGDPSSDYVNANYVDGYKQPKKYIASQGCNKYTIQDMWRMVWQLKIKRIIMVTNLVENGKRKCEQYYPDLAEEKIYRDMTVNCTDVEPTSDFVIRTFSVTKEGHEGKLTVKQFHFTSWPDHGAPLRAGPILAFRRKIKSFDSTMPGIQLIHCSAGVGRTGTYIAIDYLLDRAKAENIIDAYTITWQMRQSRVNMIQTVEQYIFVYVALLEALKSGETSIACNQFVKEFEKLKEVDPVNKKSKLQVQFEKLQLMSPQFKAVDCKSSTNKENTLKNRFPDRVPADRHRPYLMLPVEGTNDYINAVFLDGFKKRNAFIITQMPMPHTVIDFWRMVYEHSCGSVVMLNPMDTSDETYGQYWLEEEGCECGPFIIEPLNIDNTNPNITFREIQLSYEPQSPSIMKKEEKPRLVGQFQFNCWPKESDIPTSAPALQQLLELVERWQQRTGDGPIIVHCHDGLKASGLYAAVSCNWEKMKVDHEVDLFHSVKHLRYQRPGIINTMEQFEFCHEMVLAYLQEFELYSNFR